MFNCRQKINFILHTFLEILKRYCELVILGTLGMPGYAHLKWYHHLLERADVYLQANNRFHNSLLFSDILFHRILQFDWSTAFWSITQEPEFRQIWDWWWNITNSTSFFFRLFPGKTNDKFFKKSKITYLFVQIWGKINFPRKRALSVFKYQFYLPPCKNQKKLVTHSWEKCQTIGQTERDRQLWFYRTLSRMGGSNSFTVRKSFCNWWTFFILKRYI